MLIAGGEDAERRGGVASGSATGSQQQRGAVDEAIADITDAIRDRVQV